MTYVNANHLKKINEKVQIKLRVHKYKKTPPPTPRPPPHPKQDKVFPRTTLLNLDQLRDESLFRLFKNEYNNKKTLYEGAARLVIIFKQVFINLEYLVKVSWDIF